MPGRPRKRAAKAAKAKGQKPPKEFCGGKKGNGEPCLRDAGWGTDHPGIGYCKQHGGDTTNQKTNVAGAEAAGMAKPLAVTPGQAMQGVMRLAAGQLMYATSKVAELKDGDEMGVHGMWEMTEAGPMPNRWIRLQGQLMDKLAKYGKACADMGMAERQQALAEEQTQMLGRFLEHVVGDLGLTAAQQKRLGPAIRKHMPLLVQAEEQTVA